MDHKNRSEFVLHLLKNFPSSSMPFEQMGLLYQEEYGTSEAVANRSLWVVLRRLKTMKKVAMTGEKFNGDVTLLR